MRRSADLHVGFVTNVRGGVYYFSRTLANGLMLKGCFVDFLFLSRPSLKDFYRFLVGRNFDILHINFSSLAPFSCFKRRLHGVSSIETVHGVPQPWLEPSLKFKVGYSLESFFLSRMNQCVDVFVSISRYVSKELKRIYGVNSVVIHNGIDLSKVVHLDKLECKRKLGFSSSDKVVLFVGKMHPYKDPLTLVRAFPHILNEVGDTFLLMVGRGELLGEVKRIVKRLGLMGSVFIFGEVSRGFLEICYNAADVFVLPSVNEAFGIVLLEAMAHGVPVVASNSGACPEVIGDAGLLFSPGDHFDLADKILRLLTDEELVRRLGEVGVRRVKKFSVDKMVESYFRLYMKLL